MKILFVCTGNTCRSPMAEVIARALLSENNKDWVAVESRGLAVPCPMPASAHAISVMAEQGLDLTGHVARQLTEEDVAEAGLILTMTQSHKQAILPLRVSGVLTLKEFAGLSGDILDPYGGDMDVYRACAEEIFDCLRGLPYGFAID